MHYVITIQVKAVTSASETKEYSRVIEVPRHVASVANISVAGKTIEEVQKKAIAHITLLEDGGEINV